MFNAHVWIVVSDEVLARWQKKLRKPLGLMVKPLPKGVSPLQVDTMDLFAAFAHILPPVDQLHFARLRYYLKRLLTFCPQGNWDLLWDARDLDNGWLQSCSASFAWFLPFYIMFYQVPGAPPDASDLLAWFHTLPWMGRFKKAAKGCLRFRQAVAEQKVWLKTSQSTFESRGWSASGISEHQRRKVGL